MSAEAPLRLLCTGDLHLGRRPTRTRSQDEQLSVGHVWQRIVDHAIRQDVDALLLTGDIVDADNDYFEAFGLLQRGLKRLEKARVPTYVVAGNHDYDVLPRLLDVLSGDLFHLLGRGGSWETAVLRRGETPALRLAGWSFPARHVDASPVDALTLEKSELPTIALVHGDLDKRESRYAPLVRHEMAAHPADAWLLGHIHQPTYRTDGACHTLYPGSPQPLDPGEEGCRGPWMITVDSRGSIAMDPVPLATLEYASLVVDLTSVGDHGGFREAVTTTLQGDLAARCSANPDVRRVIYRLRYRGRTAVHRRVDEWDAQVTRDLVVPHGEAMACVDVTMLETRPDLDLVSLARSSDPPGVLAHLLLEMQQQGSDEAEELVRHFQQELNGVFRSKAYGPLRRDARTTTAPGQEEVREMIIRQGLLLIDETMKQQEERQA